MVARVENVTLIGYPYQGTPTTYSYKNSLVPYGAVSETGWFRNCNFELKSGDKILVDCLDIQGWVTVKADGMSVRGGDVPLFKIQINSPDDFPKSSTGELIVPGGTLCEINGYYETDKTTLFKGGKIQGLGTLNETQHLYTGTGNAFLGDGFSVIMQDIVVSAPNGQVIKKINGGPGIIALIQFLNSQVVACQTAMEILDASPVIVRTSTIGGIAGAYGIRISGSTVIVFSTKEITMTGLTAGAIGIDLTDCLALEIEITDFICPVSFGNNAGAIAVSGLADSGNIVISGRGSIKDCNFNGLTMPTQNIEPSDSRWEISESPPVTDSTVRGRLRYKGSALLTVMAVGAGIPVPINAVWTDGAIESRIQFRDKLTFDNTTNTCTSIGGAIDSAQGAAFSHGLTNSDRIKLVENGGLPAELSEQFYYVGGVTANTFQLYQEVGLSTLVTFTDDGTGINYYNQSTGNSSSGWFVYIGEKTVSIAINGWVTIQKNSGPDAATRGVIMTTDASFVVSRGADCSTVSAKNGIPQSSIITDEIIISENEGFLVYVENIEGIISNLMPDARVIASLA